jgi:hypothetical protein
MLNDELNNRVLAINSANLACNLEILTCTLKVLEESKKSNERIEMLLSELLEVLKRDS